MKKKNVLFSAFMKSGFSPATWAKIPNYYPDHLQDISAPNIHNKNRHRVIPPNEDFGINPFSWKTLLFLPQFAFKKAKQTGADCFIIDFQDAVPLPAKASVREGLKKAIEAGDFGNTPIVIRINENAIAEEKKLDLDALIGMKGIAALMPTMTDRPEELDALHRELLIRERKLGIKEGSTKLLPLIETPAAVLRADVIAQSGGGRIIGLF